MGKLVVVTLIENSKNCKPINPAKLFTVLSKWKQLVYYYFTQTMTKEILEEFILSTVPMSLLQ